jgi:rhomboid family GlyGly-CTERM serine protease
VTPDRNASLDTGRLRLFRRYPLFWSIAALSTALSLGGDTAMEWARYQRALVGQGQLWRLLTAHFVHLGWSHLILDLAALGLLALLFDGLLRTSDWLVSMAVSIASIDAGFYFIATQVDWYVGLSGMLHGVAATGAIRWCLRGVPLGYVLAVAVAAKVAWEQIEGPSAFSVAASGGPVLVDAHLYGALGGILAAGALAVLQRQEKRPL